MKKILITGASGFVGSHLCELLSQVGGFEIFGTVFGPGSDISAFVPEENQLQINLLDEKAVETAIADVNPLYVVHLAALSSPKASFSDGGKTASDNFRVQLILLEALHRHAPHLEKVLVIGSAEEYGLVDPKDVPVDESTSLKPMSPYAVSKVAQDFLGLQYFLTYAMPVVRLRPFNHTGERRPPHFVLPAFAQQVARIEAGLQKPVIEVGNLEAIRDFTDVKDMVKAYLAALEKAKPGEVYNLGSGVGVSIQDLLNRVLAKAKKEIAVQVDEGKMKPADVPVLIANSAKFHHDTDWQPEIPLDDTIERVLDYWRQQVRVN